MVIDAEKIHNHFRDAVLLNVIWHDKNRTKMLFNFRFMVINSTVKTRNVGGIWYGDESQTCLSITTMHCLWWNNYKRGDDAHLWSTHNTQSGKSIAHVVGLAAVSWLSAMHGMNNIQKNISLILYPTNSTYAESVFRSLLPSHNKIKQQY
jgi:hypothetical protein